MRGHVSSYTTSRDRRWRIVWYDGDGRHDKRGFRTKGEAERFLGRQIHGDDDEPEATEVVTFGEWMEGRWLPSMRGTVRPNTFRNYETQHRRHLAPTLGAVLLADLTTDQVADVLDLLSDDLAPSYVRNIGTMLRQALGDAVTAGMLSRNPAADVNLPQTDRATVETWTAAELARFLGTIGRDRLAALWTVMATTGLRRGEALALAWTDVDLDTPQLSVNANLSVVDGRIVVGRPKTRSSVRTVRLDRATVAAVRAHKARQAAERLAAGTSWTDSGLVFTRTDGTPLRPDQVSRWFGRAAADAELPAIGLHGLRHSHATIALRSGVPMKVLSHRLGHASIQTTIDLYAHVSPAWDQEAADLAAAAVFGQEGAV